jgi:hypothetical protein
MHTRLTGEIQAHPEPSKPSLLMGNRPAGNRHPRLQGNRLSPITVSAYPGTHTARCCRTLQKRYTLAPSKRVHEQYPMLSTQALRIRSGNIWTDISSASDTRSSKEEETLRPTRPTRPRDLRKWHKTAHETWGIAFKALP